MPMCQVSHRELASLALLQPNASAKNMLPRSLPVGQDTTPLLCPENLETNVAEWRVHGVA